MNKKAHGECMLSLSTRGVLWHINPENRKVAPIQEWDTLPRHVRYALQDMMLALWSTDCFDRRYRFRRQRRSFIAREGVFMNSYVPFQIRRFDLLKLSVSQRRLTLRYRLKRYQ